MRKFFVYRLEVSEKKRNFARWYVGVVHHRAPANLFYYLYLIEFKHITKTMNTAALRRHQLPSRASANLVGGVFLPFHCLNRSFLPSVFQAIRDCCKCSPCLVFCGLWERRKCFPCLVFYGAEGAKESFLCSAIPMSLFMGQGPVPTILSTFYKLI